MVQPTWQERLRAGGHRITPQRASILAAVAELEHPTPESILQHLKPSEPTLNASTVYRTLAVLQDLGLITHAHIGSGSPVYHLADTPPHIHLSCLSCGAVESLPVPAGATFAAEVESVNGFRIDPTHSAIFGVCARCRAAAGT